MKKLLASITVLLFLCFFLLPTISFADSAGEVSLAWDPPKVSTDVAGYQSPYSNEVSKNISPAQYLLAASKPGTGEGLVASVSGPEISCGDTCLAVFDPDTVVTLSATPDPGSTFEGWSGGECSGTGLCTVTMSANYTVV